MERRLFLKSLLGLAGATVVGVASSIEAHALTVSQPPGVEPSVRPNEAIATAEDVADAKIEKAQYYYRRWRPVRRRVFVRRYYRPRYFVRRRVYRRRFFY